MTHFLEQDFSFGGYWPEIFHAKTAATGSAETGSAATGSAAADVTATDADFMREAMREAMKTCGLPSPNPNVGAIFVKNGHIVARGSTEPWGGLHGERKAVQTCADPAALVGSTLYVGLEPCSHYGKQPPCLDSIIPLKLARCVVASVDPHHLVAGAGINALKVQGVKVEVGLLNAEWRAWNFPFYAQLISKKPIFIAKWAQTLDGFMADDEGLSQWITGAKSRAYTHWLRMKYDAIMVGAGTLIQDKPSLTVRDVPDVLRQPTVIVFDPRGRLLTQTPQARQEILQKFSGETRKFLYLTRAVHCSNADALWTKHPQVLTVALDEGAQMWRTMADHLATSVVTHHLGKPLQSVLVEGGPKLLTQMLRAEMVDLCHVFLATQFMFGRANRLADPLHLAGEDVVPVSHMATRQMWAPLSRFSLDADSVIEMVAPKWLPLFQSAVL